MNKRFYGLALAALLALGLLAGCGSSNDTSSDSSKAAAPASGPETINVAFLIDTHAALVDSRGYALYLFEKDTSTTSTCSDACAEAWPPVTTDGAPVAGESVTASMLRTSRRSDGTTQVTYAGHPLYRFSGDRKPGDTNGQEADAFGAEWYAVSPNGDTVEGAGSGDADSGSDSSDTDSSGY